MPFSSKLASSASGDWLMPWERANLTGFSCHPLTVLTIDSMSSASITDTGQGIEREGERERGKDDQALPQATTADQYSATLSVV